MKFPFVLNDFAAGRELLRINPDASITVLEWEAIETWARTPVCIESGVLIAICRVISAARYNFIETAKDESDQMGRAYQGPTKIVGVRGERFISGLIYGLTKEYVWQVNWPLIESIRAKERMDTTNNVISVGLSNLFLAAKDNFVTEPFK
jgi:hypothetical protein